MLLKDLMEEKQLNLNQPLLSVRRFSSTLASETDHKSRIDDSLARLALPPAYKSEFKSVPERNAGTVPFVWEKVPGRPKDESQLQTQVVENAPTITPNFPPGRVSKTKQQSLADMRTGSTLSNSHQRVASLDKRVTKHSKEESKDKQSSGSDDGDEAFEDARDSLSRTESFFMSCRMSGWDEEEVLPSASFTSDHLQGRDFMIDRFLLAAKAMTSEAPQYASKKARIGQQEQQKKKRKEAVDTESSCPQNQHRPQALPHYTQDIYSEKSEDESDDCNESENYTATTCGLFPRFCLLNPMTGLRMVDKVQRNAAHGMQAKSAASHIGSSKEQGRTHYGKKLVDSQPGFTEEKEILDILVKSKHCTDPHQRGCSKLVSCESIEHDSSYESHVHEKTLYVDSEQKVKSQTNDTRGDFETLRRDSGIQNNPSIDSSPKVVKYKKINSESQVHGRDKNYNILTQNSEVDLKKQLAAKWVDQECNLARSKVRYDRKIDLESSLTKLGHQELSGLSCFGLSLSLPSLKAPSESWLKRTLPTICKKNMTSQSNNLTANIYARNKIPKTTSSLHPKWETIVKSSNTYHGHLQLPEDLQTPISKA